MIQNFKWLYRVDHNTISANLAQNQHKTIDQKLYKAQNKQPTEEEEEEEEAAQNKANLPSHFVLWVSSVPFVKLYELNSIYIAVGERT